jgi:1,4-dihydroxy-2-naphthoate octaprenyltransferase
MNTLRQLIRLSRPPLLLIAALMYLLGCGVVHYLGLSIDWTIYWLGQAWLFLVQMIVHALNDYFETPAELRNPSRTLLIGSSGSLEMGKLPRPAALWISVASGLTVSLITVLIIQRLNGADESQLVMLGLVLVGLVYSIPPLRLSLSGYGELLMSFFLMGMVPAYAFTLQDAGLHRLVLMIAFPLMCIFLALLLIVEFPNYATDVKYERINLLVRLGWQRGIFVHNILIFAGFSFLGLALVFGMPERIAFPVFAVLPVGLYQIWMISRVGQGGRPNWNLLTILASATFGFSAYLLTYGFWTH